MINHLFLYKERGSLLILSLTSSTDKCGAALVLLAIALFSRSWFSLFRIIPQTASWYENCLKLATFSGGRLRLMPCQVLCIDVLYRYTTLGMASRRVWQAELAILSLQKKTTYEINTSW